MERIVHRRMAKNKKYVLQLEAETDSSFSILLLHSQFDEDYYVAYLINNLLELSLKQMDYHKIIEGETIWKFPLFQAYSNEWKEYFFLVRNESLSVVKQQNEGLFEGISTKRFLLPKYHTFNFILVSTAKIPQTFLLLLRQSRWMNTIKTLKRSMINDPINFIFEPIIPAS